MWIVKRMNSELLLYGEKLKELIKKGETERQSDMQRLRKGMVERQSETQPDIRLAKKWRKNCRQKVRETGWQVDKEIDRQTHMKG